MKLEVFFGFLLCLIAILFALYLEFFQGLDPCPLCVLQRVALVGAGFFYLIAWIHFWISKNPNIWTVRAYGVLVLAFTLFGLVMAIKQIYIQHLPLGEAPACGPGLEYLRQTLPWDQFIAGLFQGDGECAVTGTRFISLSLSEWSAVLFTLLSLLNIHLICRRFSASNPGEYQNG